MKIKKSISVSIATADRLKQIAKEHHTTVSQLITNWVWQTHLTGEQCCFEKTVSQNDIGSTQ